MKHTRRILAATLAYVTLVALWPRRDFTGLGVLAAVLVGAGFGLGVSWRHVAKGVARVEIFVLGVAGLAVFQRGGAWIAASLLLKAHLCVAAMMVMAQCVPRANFLDALRGWGMPDSLLMPLALMERYHGVLGREWQRLLGARRSRTFVGRGWRGFPLAECLGALLARSLARAERIAGAMRARGWGDNHFDSTRLDNKGKT